MVQTAEMGEELDTVGADELAWLLDRTREALCGLQAEELEELAQRAERIVRVTAGTLDARVVRAKLRVLGELLEATAANLAVTRRMRGESVELRWVR
jgi:hypothetical protein